MEGNNPTRWHIDPQKMISTSVKDANGNPIQPPRYFVSKRYRWFDHNDPFESKTSLKNRTIGYGHVLTTNEVKTGTIKVREWTNGYLTSEVNNIFTQGLRDDDVNDLLNLDTIKRVENVQKILGPERWNLLINGGTINGMNYPPHPAWAALLVNLQYNGGNTGIREWPQLLYSMGLITNKDNMYEYDPIKKKIVSKLSIKNSDGSYKYPSINSLFMIGEQPYKPMSPLLLNSRANIKKIADNCVIPKLRERSKTLVELFLYPGILSPGYVEIVDKTKLKFDK
jgi:hypothetical protein